VSASKVTYMYTFQRVMQQFKRPETFETAEAKIFYRPDAALPDTQPIMLEH